MLSFAMHLPDWKGLVGSLVWLFGKGSSPAIGDTVLSRFECQAISDRDDEFAGKILSSS